ncbi:hypothetical protein GOP47_0018291 [Adiantum capillus-veneris]|uniref:Uncharacterized protein n=1 Tax=Adiantum capillus-veneris TaxID=13818 RepID=A0A9D4Z9Z9_ADICA|nr:hypothetical protein GOP47_0018291 [Adiantum capillus-veneris]
MKSRSSATTCMGKSMELALLHFIPIRAREGQLHNGDEVQERRLPAPPHAGGSDAATLHDSNRGGRVRSEEQIDAACGGGAGGEGGGGGGGGNRRHRGAGGVPASLLPAQQALQPHQGPR